MYNKVILIGRLVAAPELHKTSTDKSVARVTVAVNRRYKDQNGDRETDFVNVVVWGKLAETMASYASKGSLISLDGRDSDTPLREKWGHAVCDRGPLSKFSVAREPRSASDA